MGSARVAPKRLGSGEGQGTAELPPPSRPHSHGIRALQRPVGQDPAPLSCRRCSRYGDSARDASIWRGTARSSRPRSRHRPRWVHCGLERGSGHAGGRHGPCERPSLPRDFIYQTPRKKPFFLPRRLPERIRACTLTNCLCQPEIRVYSFPTVPLRSPKAQQHPCGQDATPGEPWPWEGDLNWFTPARSPPAARALGTGAKPRTAEHPRALVVGGPHQRADALPPRPPFSPWALKPPRGNVIP